MSNKSEYVDMYIDEIQKIINLIDRKSIEKAINILIDIKKQKGRIFFIGVGGGAGNASHAVNDFRKISEIECYTPTDNVSELTARINDDGWDSAYTNWLKGCSLSEKDCVFVFSVGGGNLEKNISTNLVNSLIYARDKKSKIIGIVGRDGGYTAKVADTCIIIPTVNNNTVTPHTESFQSVIWHLMVSHPLLNSHGMKWETVK